MEEERRGSETIPASVNPNNIFCASMLYNILEILLFLSLFFFFSFVKGAREKDRHTCHCYRCTQEHSSSATSEMPQPHPHIL